MIYFGVWNQLYETRASFTNNEPINDHHNLVEILKQTTDTLVFVLNREQFQTWKSHYKERYYKDFVQYEMEQPITNFNYGERRLHLIILKGTGK